MGRQAATYLRGANLISDGTSYYLYNAHGDVVQLTDSTGAVTKSYDYDAFGNERDPDEEDTNPFRYCGEYFDKETGTYYLRARYYDPLIGRFTQADTHWNTANMIYGDNPQKINEREDALGLKTYSYAPQISAVMQSGNLYVYGVNNPVTYADRTGCAIETPIDLVTLAFSVADVAANPTNVWAWVGLAGDAIDLIPFVTGVGEGVRTLRIAMDATDKLGDAAKLGKLAKMEDLVDGFKSFTQRNFRKNLQTLTKQTGKGMEAHHVLPQALRDQFDAAHINIDNPIFGAWVDSSHQKWSYAYNQEWRAFFKQVENPTIDQILEKAREMAAKYGFEIYF